MRSWNDKYRENIQVGPHDFHNHGITELAIKNRIYCLTRNITQLTVIWLKFCFRTKEEHLSGEDITEGWLIHVNPQSWQKKLWNSSLTQNTEPSSFSTNLMRHMKFLQILPMNCPLETCRYVQRPLAVWSSCEKQGKTSCCTLLFTQQIWNGLFCLLSCILFVLRAMQSLLWNGICIIFLFEVFVSAMLHV